jgi:colicin import membrane protein
MQRKREPMSKALLLALGMHVLLIIALALSTRWKSSEPAAVEAELWSATPQIAAVVKPAPPPEPKLKPEPEPVAKAPVEPAPDIALEQKKKEAERKKLELAQQEQVKKDEKLKQEREKKAQDAADAKLRDEITRERDAKIAKMMGNAAQTSSPNQRSLGTAGAGSRFSIVATGKVKDNLNFPEGDYKPATAMVTLAPDGTVLDVKFTKPSGNPAQDAAIERAIKRTARFPPENPGEAYRQVELVFTPSN